VIISETVQEVSRGRSSGGEANRSEGLNL